MHCTSCGAENPAHAKFCHACGAPQATGPVPCKRCGKPNDAKARFCVHCGAADPGLAVTPAEQRATARRSPWLAAGALLVVAGVAGGAWWAGSRSGESGTPAATAPLQAPAVNATPTSPARAPAPPQPSTEGRAPQAERPASAAVRTTPAAPRPAAAAAPAERAPKPAPRKTQPEQPAAAPPARKPGSGAGWYAEYLAAREACRQNSSNFFSRTTCLEKAKWRYCNDGHWGEVPECPTGSGNSDVN